MAKPYRKLLAFKHSQDHGNRWRTVAICEVCKDSVEPPDLLKPMGEAAVRSCDWCACGNINDKPVEPVRTEREIEAMQGFKEAISNYAKDQGIQDPFEDEGLPPNEVCDLSIAYSPVIPKPHGQLRDAVEVEKINDFTYRYQDQFGELSTVSDEVLKTMRIRYLVKHGEYQSAYMVANNPPDHIFHIAGKKALGDKDVGKILFPGEFS